ncbi:DUF2442 domain-containing protein [Promineifilum sp.]|uniref:DUF2442 domain-containing protein n=1 Tax=Promineifilum sp. TaxID=2664178 RepID=UPI0035AEB192
MTSPSEETEEAWPVKWYRIAYRASEYAFPKEALIHDVRIDGEYVHVDLTDGRILSIPLWWIPSVHNAPVEDRHKFEISRSRTMIIWDPEKGSINDELRIEDYLVPRNQE